MIGHTPLECLALAKKHDSPKTQAIKWWYGYMQCENIT